MQNRLSGSAHHLSFPENQERSQAARRRRKARGRRWTNTAPFGYRWCGSRRRRQRLAPDARERDAAQKIVAMRAAGQSWRAIAVALLWSRERTRYGAEWSVSRVRRIYAAALAGRLTAYDHVLARGARSVRREAQREAQARKFRQQGEAILAVFGALIRLERRSRRR